MSEQAAVETVHAVAVAAEHVAAAAVPAQCAAQVLRLAGQRGPSEGDMLVLVTAKPSLLCTYHTSTGAD